MSSLRTQSVFSGLMFSVLLLTALPGGASAKAPMTKERISQEIIGKTLDAKRMGMPVRIFYKRDKTVAIKFAIMSGAGTWNYSNNGICMLLNSGPRKGKTCVSFEHIGDNKYRNSEGIVFTVRKE